jgi:hypothetical protein
MEEVKRSLRFRDRVASVASEFRFAVVERDPFGPVRRRLNKMTAKAISSILPNLSSPQSQAMATIKDANLIAFASFQPTVDCYCRRLNSMRRPCAELCSKGAFAGS